MAGEILIMSNTQDSSEYCPNAELNGKDAHTRSAPMQSEPKTIIKRRIKGALVPIAIPPQ